MPSSSPANNRKNGISEVSGQVFDEDGYLTCGIIIKNDSTQDKQFYITDKVGRYNLSLQKGSYELTFFKDSQYEIKVQKIEIKNQLPIRFSKLLLNRLYDFKQLGYISADLHQHTVFSDGSNTPYDLNNFNRALKLDFAFLTDHNSVDGGTEYLFNNNSNSSFIAGLGVEVTSDEDGHFNVLNTDKTYSYNFNSAADMEATVNAAKSERTFVQVNHPSKIDILGFNIGI